MNENKRTTDPIYLDHNATTPVAEPVLEAMLPYLRRDFGNPSSGHVYGARAHEAVEQARKEVAKLLGCEALEVVFTSGGTESNNLAIRGVADVFGGGHVVTSTVEHPATATPCWHLEESGWKVTRVAVDSAGRVSASDVVAQVRDHTHLVTVMLANNETGTLMPIGEMVRQLKGMGGVGDNDEAQSSVSNHRVTVHVDAAQAVGKVALDVKRLGVDLLSVAGHKLYAPKGVGALYVRAGAPVMPFLLGAGHEMGLRPGTENVAGIVGLGRACQMAQQDMESEAARVTKLRDELWTRLHEEIPELRLNGHLEHRLPNTLNVGFPGVRGSAVLEQCPQVAASTGSACHEGGAETPSPVLSAMGQPPQQALEAVRLTLGRSTTEKDVRQAASFLVRAYRFLL